MQGQAFGSPPGSLAPGLQIIGFENGDSMLGLCSVSEYVPSCNRIKGSAKGTCTTGRSFCDSETDFFCPGVIKPHPFNNIKVIHAKIADFIFIRIPFLRL